MAYTVEAYYEQENNQGVTDRIEIQEDSGSGRDLELQANDQGFKWRLSEITSESDKGLINPLANKIQVGKLTFFPRIETSAEQTLLDDILGSPDSQFRIVWKQDGDVFWTGNIDNKRRSHPETGGSYFATIRANDFEILQTIDYTSDGTPSGSLFLSRQTLITTISDLLGYLNFDLNIRTATSWITQDTTDSTDFLSQVNHETKALRRFGRTGDESDEPISVWDALEKIGGPALLFRQVNGEFTVEQLTEFDDPENVNETVYTSAGAVDTATTTVDRTLDADKATSEGNLVIKDGSPNDRYPAIKRATVTFDHRTKVSGIQFEDSFSLDSGDPTKPYTQFFLSDGNQQIEITGLIEGYFPSGHDDVTADIRIRIIRSGDDYFWDGSSWGTSGATISVDLIDSGRSTPQGQLHFNGFREFTDPAPSDADGTLEITFLRADSAASGFADTTTYRNAVFDIKNTVANENSTFINYQLTQSDGYATDFELQDTWFGDGPTGYALSALRSGSSDADFIVDGWQRRGTTTGYRSFHEQLLKEIIDLQRSNTRKLNANFWGTYDPSKILVYDSQNFYCAGVSYIGHRGRWSANLFRVNLQTGSDTFEDIPKFSDSTGSGTGSSGGGGGGGSDTGTLDGRYFKQSENLSEGDPETMRGNLGLGAEDDVTFGDITISDTLDVDSSKVTWDGSLFQVDRNLVGNHIARIRNEADSGRGLIVQAGVSMESENILSLRTKDGARPLEAWSDDWVEISTLAIGHSSPSDLLDVDGAMRAETVRTNSGKFLSLTSYQFRNAGDTGFRDVEMADLAADAATLSSTLDVTGKGTFGSEVEVNGVLNVDGNIALDDSETDISTDTFASGFAGTGLAFLQDGTWDGTLDNLTVRQRLRVYELLINQIRATNGSLVVTSATKTGREDDLGFEPVQQLGGTLDWTSSDPFWTESDQYWYPTYRVYIEENQFVPFVEDDLVISQRFTGGGVHLVEGTVINVENGSETVTDNSTRRYFDINITADSDVPASGMDFVRWGNLTDPDRQGVLYLTADDDDAPYMDIVYGMDAHSKRNSSGTVKGRIGRLDGIIDPDFPTLDGTQTNEFGVYINGGYFNNVEVRGTITVLDEDASNAATKDYVDGQAGGNVTIRASSEPSQRPGGGSLEEGDIWIDTSDGDKPYSYDGNDWVRAYTIIDGGDITTGAIDAQRMDFTVVGEDNIVGTINASTETDGSGGVLTISGDKIELDGDTTVTSNFEVQGIVNGTLEMSENGEITNEDDDYTIGANGINMATSSTFTVDRAVTWDSQAEVWGSTDGVLSLRGNNGVEVVADGNIRVDVTGTDITLSNDVQIDAGLEVTIGEVTFNSAYIDGNKSNTISDGTSERIRTLDTSKNVFLLIGTDIGRPAMFFIIGSGSTGPTEMSDPSDVWGGATGDPDGSVIDDFGVYINSSGEVWIENTRGADQVFNWFFFS